MTADQAAPADPGMSTLEIRIHGVHGTSPASMLGVSTGDVGQVAGDGITGIYRPKPGVELFGRRPTESIVVEAYSWASLTSGVSGLFGWARRAAWLLLLPFALVNMAYWARPELDWQSAGSSSGADEKTRTDARTKQLATARTTARLVRFAALLLTAFAVLVTCTVGIDLLTWQCFRDGSPGCPVLPGWLDFLARDPLRSAPRRLAVGTAVPVLILVVLWFLSRQSLVRCEGTVDPAAHVSDERSDSYKGSVPAGMSGPVAMPRHRWLWTGKQRTQRLQMLHLAFGLCVVVGYSGLPIVVAGWGSEHEGVLPAGPFVWLTFVDVLAVVAAMVVVMRVGTFWSSDLEKRDENPVADDLPKSDPRARRLLGIVCGLYIAHVVVLVRGQFGDIHEGAAVFGENVWFIGVFVLLLSLNVGLFLTGRVGRNPGRAAAFLTFVALLCSSPYTWDLLHVQQVWPRWVAVVMLLGSLLAVVLWHTYYRGAEAWAWRGAAASVFVAAATWVALLFSAAVVTSVANYLNGPADSVADLGVTYRVDAVGQVEPLQVKEDRDLAANRSYTAPAPLAAPKPPERGSFAYQAVGKVTVRKAVVLVVPDGNVYVRNGKVVTDYLRRPDPDNRQVSGLIVDASAQELQAGSVLQVAGEKLTIENSCVRAASPSQISEQNAPAACRPGFPKFVASGSLAVPAGQVTVGFKGHGVSVEVTDPPQTPLMIPQVLVWAPAAQTLWLLIALVVAVVCFARLNRRRHDFADRVDEDGTIGPYERQGAITARVNAGYAHRAETLLDWIAPWTTLLALLVILGSVTGKAPWDWVPWFRPFAVIPLWVSVLSSLGLIWLASRIRTSEKTRKGVGILWDLTTFWPRAAHPLAPPCYAERVVPELTERVRWALGFPECQVVISAHSQGSAIAVAMASRLDDESLRRIRLITYGSQIRAWYGRIFPAMFGPAQVGHLETNGAPHFDDPAPDVPTVPFERVRQRLEEQVGTQSLLARMEGRTADAGPHDTDRWVNLFRRSDPLGFRVFTDSDGPDTSWDQFVVEVPPRTDGNPGPYVMTHGGYQHTDAYLETVRRWTHEEPVDELTPPIRNVTIMPDP